MINKFVDSVADALADTPDGATVLIGGFGTAGIPDELIIISMSIGFSVLVLINLLVSGGGIFYFITALLSLACGIGGVFVAQSLGGKAVLYDFKGCSCDDCASANTCPSGSKSTFLMRKISNTQS
jgi:hypothetical protein